MSECEHGQLARSCERCDDKREIEKLRAELAEAHESYDTLIQLLRRRFPRNPDGSLPDIAVEAVFRENAELRGAKAHMEARRVLLSVPEDEVLHEAIEKLRSFVQRVADLGVFSGARNKDAKTILAEIVRDAYRLAKGMK